MEALKINRETPMVVITCTPLTDRQVDIRAKKYFELDAEIKRLTAERDAVKAELMEAGSRTTKHWKVSYTEYTQPRFDSKRFKTDHKKLYEDYQMTVNSSRFSVSEV